MVRDWRVVVVWKKILRGEIVSHVLGLDTKEAKEIAGIYSKYPDVDHTYMERIKQ